MGIFLPDCHVYSDAWPWLQPASEALLVAGLALLAQVAVLWRRMGRAGIAWWGRRLLALPVVWAGACWLVVARVVGASLLSKPLGELLPGPAGATGGPPCLSPESQLREAVFALTVAVVILILGWLALSRFARRTRAA